MSEMPINAAIVGLGRWGRNLVSSVYGRSDKIRFVQAVVRNPGSAQDFAEHHQLVLGVDLDEVLRDPSIDAIVIATPHSNHPSQVIASAQAGKAVFCEKPLALTWIQARDVLATCTAAGVVLHVGHDKRYWPALKALKSIVESGNLGAVLHIDGNLSNDNSNQTYGVWRSQASEAPGGSLTATGIHVLDAFVNLMGEVRGVYARRVMQESTPQVRDTMMVFCEFRNGATGLLTSVRPTPMYGRVQIFGTSGWAHARGSTELEVLYSNRSIETHRFDSVDSLRLELEAFAEAIVGRSCSSIWPSDILHTTAVLEAAIQSVESGRFVEPADQINLG